MRNDGVTQYTDTKSLFEYCFQNFLVYNILENESSLMENEKVKGTLSSFGSYVSLDENASIVLPVTAPFSDIESSIKEVDNKDGVVARLEYTYGERMVGSANIYASGESVGENYFSDKLTQIDEEKNIIKIKPLYIVLVILSIIALVIIIILGKKLYDNFYVILHDMEIKRQRKERFRPIEKKRRKRGRRNRMFR